MNLTGIWYDCEGRKRYRRSPRGHYYDRHGNVKNWDTNETVGSFNPHTGKIEWCDTEYLKKHKLKKKNGIY